MNTANECVCSGSTWAKVRESGGNKNNSNVNRGDMGNSDNDL